MYSSMNDELSEYLRCGVLLLVHDRYGTSRYRETGINVFETPESKITVATIAIKLTPEDIGES